MKTIITTFSCLAIACQSFAQFAGDLHASPAKTRVATATELQKMEDGVLMKNGRMYVVRKGVEASMYDDMTMLDGTRVLADGSIVKLDGTKSKMQDGERMFLSGVLGKIPSEHYATMRNGKMTFVRDSVSVSIDRVLSTDNGMKIYPEGFAVTTDGKKVPFSEGDRLGMSGAWLNPERTPVSSSPQRTPVSVNAEEDPTK